jgi:ethanolamine utilization protein EutN
LRNGGQPEDLLNERNCESAEWLAFCYPTFHHSTIPPPHYTRMLLARVEGNLTATRKHPSFEGWRLVICQPINNAGDPEGVPQVAIDALGAGMHQRVILSSDGLAARKAVRDDKSPVRWMIIGIVDEKEPGVPV